MTESSNLRVYRGTAHALDRPRYETAFTLLAVPLACALGVVALRSRRLRPLLSAFAVIGLARSAARLLAQYRHDDDERRIDQAVEQSFPASDPPAF
jgi:hypothetical protein